MPTISSKEAADQLGISVQAMLQFLAAGRVEGAKRRTTVVKVKKQTWRIPTPVKITPGQHGPGGVAGRTQDTKGE